MSIQSFIAILILGATLGSSLFFFSWDLVLAATVLLLLFYTQFRFVAKRLVLLRSLLDFSQASQNSTPSAKQGSRAIAPGTTMTDARAKVLREAPSEQQNRLAGQALDQQSQDNLSQSQHFQEFRRNLEQQSQTAAPGTSPLALQQDEGKEEVVVKLSSQAKRKNPYAQQAALSDPILKQPPATPVSPPPTHAHTAQHKRAAAIASHLQNMAHPPPEGADEIFAENDGLAAPTDSLGLRESSPPTPSEEIPFAQMRQDAAADLDQLLLEVERLRTEHKLKEANDRIDVWLKLFADTGKKKPEVLRLLWLKAQNLLDLDQFSESVEAWKEYFVFHTRHFEPASRAEKLQAVVDLLQHKEQITMGMPFLFMLLDLHRRSEAHQQMVQTYSTIADIYRQSGDAERLLQTLQNKLTILKTLKNFQGQLAVLDELGKLYFDRKDENGSRACYRQSVAIRKQMEEHTKNATEQELVN